MADQGFLPIRFQEHAQLQSLGINAASIGFNTLTMESDRFVCVRERVGEQSQVAIVDIESPDSVLRRPITADAAIMSPDARIIALRSGRQLQVFDLERKVKMASHNAPADVVFWKWVDGGRIALVTETAVFHWSIDPNHSSDPKRIFERHASLSGCQIINYRTDASGRWILLVGISAEQGRVVGRMQLYHTDRGVSQLLEGHAGVFAKLRLDGAPNDTKIFAFAVRTPTAATLHLVEIDHPEGNPVFQKRTVDVFFPEEAVNDFPVAMQFSSKYGVLYLVTKYGFIHIYDVESGACIFMNRISSDTIFVTAEHRATGGIIGVNRRGQVLSVSIDEQTMVPHALKVLNNPELAVKLASRCDLPGADDLFTARFGQLMQAGDAVEAAKLAARSPRGVLRTPQTIEQLKSVVPAQGQMSPLLQYFGILLEQGKLNRTESLELAHPVLQQGKKALLEKWLKENKLDCSEELGDVVRQYDLTLALSVYLRADVPEKVCDCFAELGQFSKIMLFAGKVGYQPDYCRLLESVVCMDPERGAEFARILAKQESLVVDLEKILDIFASKGLVQQATSSLIESLQTNKPEHAHIQTRILELNIKQAPDVADAILSTKTFTKYDRITIARLCEGAGLCQKALEHYSDIEDIERVFLGATEKLGSEWIVGFFARLAPEQIMRCLRSLMTQDLQDNLQTCIQAAIKYSGKIPPSSLINLFEQHKCFEGLYYYLGSIVNESKDADVHFSYIQAACRTGQMKEVERICRESSSYDPERVKNFLKEARLSEQLPLIIVCDRFNFVHDLVLYLYQNDLPKFIEVYVQRVNPSRTPAVAGALLDVGCAEDVVHNLIFSIRGTFSIDDLVGEMEERNQLRLLLPYLERKVQEDASQDSSVFNALAKIYIDQNMHADTFLRENSYYDPLVVGQYCEKRDPQLALIAYERGNCDKEFIRLTNDNAMFKQQGRYLVKRRDPALWKFVLEATNAHRPALADQLISNSIPDAQDAESVSVAVKAFMVADMPAELIRALEKLLFDGVNFSDNRNLQNLLLLTAIKSRAANVMDYLSRLRNYDGAAIAKVAVETSMFEEAFQLYKAAADNVGAIGVLLDHINSIGRAQDFAITCNQREVWGRLGKSQIRRGLVPEAIESFKKADDYTDFASVISQAADKQKFEELVSFLRAARTRIREQTVDTELAYALAKVNDIRELEAFIAQPNLANIQAAGDRCYQDKMYQAARILYASISNHAKLAVTLVHLRDFNNAIDCARKANSIRVWRDLNLACLEETEFRLAHVCGMNLVVHADELDELVYAYESRGYMEQLVQLLEAALSLERAHVGLFTELAIIYTKHQPEKLMEHLSLYWSRLTIPRVLRACEAAHLWSELVLLHLHSGDHEKAALSMVEHGSDAFDHDRMCKVVPKIANQDALDKVFLFYYEQHPMQLNDILTLAIPRIDPGRVVQKFQSLHRLALIKAFLVSAQSTNSVAVNTALNGLLIEEEDHQGLLASIERSSNFDGLELARRLEKHSLSEFRRVAAHLYKHSQCWNESVQLLAREGLCKEAIETAADSKDQTVAEDLLYRLAATRNQALFIACLYGCNELLRPDVVVELAWRNGWNEFAMPYMCQALRNYEERLARVEKTVGGSAGVPLPAHADTHHVTNGFGQLMITQQSSLWQG